MVVISIARHRSSIAIGNIVGSTISNILGAFALGLLFHKSKDERLFDRSSKIYASLLLVLTSLIAGVIAFGHGIPWRVVGGFAIGLFVAYIISIAWIIYKGQLSAPELSDTESSDGEAEGHHDGDSAQERHSAAGRFTTESGREGSRTATDEAHAYKDNPHTSYRSNGPSSGLSSAAATETTPLRASSLSLELGGTNAIDSFGRLTEHKITYHLGLLLVGMLAVILSAYVLSHAATNLVSQLGISDVAFGVVILSIATTIPEKSIAVVSGSRGQMGIMIANTVGSNIFLLSLCMGILWVSTDGVYDHGSVKPTEIGVMLGSAVAMTLTVWAPAKSARFIGATMLVAYIAFLVLEFTVIHQV